MVNQQFRFPKNHAQRYALMGLLFGLLFPIVATLYRLIELGLPFGIASAVLVQASDPLLWIIDTAPFVLALPFAIAGRRLDKLQKANAELTDRERELSNANENITRIVEDHTRSLDKRTAQLRAVADVGKSITSYRTLSELLQQTTFIIHDNFGYYHVGIFLIDERGEYAVLAASNSEGGRRMLESGHRLKVGGAGIVGAAAGQIKARIAMNVGDDAVFFDNPHLPETRSEMALPLVAGGQLLGVLDVQSRELGAFTEDDTSTLQILAEQIAVATQNANLFSETEKALEKARILYGAASREAWSKIIRSQTRIGYIATPPATIPIHTDVSDPDIVRAINTGDLIASSNGLTINLPIEVRGQVIGAIRLKKPEIADAWTDDETNLAVALADQLSGALESARLYRESQQRAARESLVSEISARINTASQIDAILRETVHELGQAIGNASVSFQLLDQPNGRKQAKSADNGSAPSVAKGKAG